MVIRVREAVKEALDKIQELGFVVLSAHDGEHVEVVWMQERAAPDIDRLLMILETDQSTLESLLKERTVPIPLWLVLGYPWERPQKYWSKLSESGVSKQGLNRAKQVYAERCVAFYKNKRDMSWKRVSWQEPWPLIA